MAIHHPEAFDRWRPAGYDGKFDWDWLIPALGDPKFAPTDIDGLIERHSHFLVFETKAPGAPLKEGQRIVLEELMRLGRITVVFLAGKRPEEIVGMTLWRWNRRNETIEEKRFPSANSDTVFRYVERWWKWASSQPRRPRLPVVVVESHGVDSGSLMG